VTIVKVTTYKDMGITCSSHTVSVNKILIYYVMVHGCW